MQLLQRSSNHIWLVSLLKDLLNIFVHESRLSTKGGVMDAIYRTIINSRNGFHKIGNIQHFFRKCIGDTTWIVVTRARFFIFLRWRHSLSGHIDIVNSTLFPNRFINCFAIASTAPQTLTKIYGSVPQNVRSQASWNLFVLTNIFQILLDYGSCPPRLFIARIWTFDYKRCKA